MTRQRAWSLLSTLALLPFASALAAIRPLRTVAPLARAHTRLCAEVAGKVDVEWQAFASENGIVAPKLAVRTLSEDDRGKGGVVATETISPMEVIATIPRSMILSPSEAAISAAASVEEPSWAAELTAAALLLMHPDGAEDRDAAAKRAWLETWTTGGWATNNADLGEPGVRWGRDDVTGCLMATGSMT